MLYVIYISNFRCESSISQIVRIPDKQKLFECDFPDCFRFYESIDQLNLHKCYMHNQEIGFDPNVMKQDMSIMNPLNSQRIPTMNYQQGGMMSGMNNQGGISGYQPMMMNNQFQ